MTETKHKMRRVRANALGYVGDRLQYPNSVFDFDGAPAHWLVDVPADTPLQNIDPDAPTKRPAPREAAA